MAGNAWKWLVGCGIGCVAVLLIVAILGGGSFYFLRGVARDLEETQRGMDAVTERFGRPADFRPDPDGAIRPERIELFLDVRGALAETRSELERDFLLLHEGQDGDGDESDGGVVGKIRAGIGLVHKLMAFFTARADALLEHEMGLGEYYYIYSLAYYSWLGHSPADGPPFRLVGDSDQTRSWDGESFGEVDEFEVREERTERILREVRGQLLPMLRNQLEDLDAQGGSDAAGPWREALAAEIAALEADPLRLPWADGLPAVVEESLHPFRDRLEQSYSEQCSSLEFGLGHD
jgi:hypothetical protein